MEAVQKMKPQSISDKQYINRQTILRKLRTYKRQPLSLFLLILVMLAALITFGVFVFLIGYILINGIPNIKPSLFAWKYTTENVSMLPAMINTVYMTALTLLIAVPVGVFSAIYLVEYSKGEVKL